jgi:hypothetical protein
MNFLQPLSSQAQHARKIYTSAASKNDVSTLFRIDYRCYLVINDIGSMNSTDKSSLYFTRLIAQINKIFHA